MYFVPQKEGIWHLGYAVQFEKWADTKKNDTIHTPVILFNTRKTGQKNTAEVVTV